MAYRYTNTDKWNDQWFSDLKQTAKLLFIYLCDQCDIAGFLEFNEKKAAFDTGIDKQGINKAMKDIEGRIIYSKDRKYIFILNFLKHQRNLPLNKNANPHKGIIERLEKRMNDFDFQDINDFFINPSLRVNVPLTKGTNICNGKEEKEEIGGMGEKEERETKAKSEKFLNFEKWIKENAPSVSKLKEPFTEKQYDKLSKEYTHDQLKEIISAMHNHKNLTKKYSSANLTFRDWAKRRYGDEK